MNVVSQQPQPCWHFLPSTQEGDSGKSGCMGESVLAHWLNWDGTRVFHWWVSHGVSRSQGGAVSEAELGQAS